VVLNKLKKRIGEKKKEKASNTISFIVSRANSGSKFWFLSGKNTILSIQIVLKIVIHFYKKVVWNTTMPFLKAHVFKRYVLI